MRNGIARHIRTNIKDRGPLKKLYWSRCVVCSVVVELTEEFVKARDRPEVRCDKHRRTTENENTG